MTVARRTNACSVVQSFRFASADTRRNPVLTVHDLYLTLKRDFAKNIDLHKQ